MKKSLTVRNVAIGIATVLLLICALICVFLFPRSVAAEQPTEGIYANVNAIYNIGDQSIVGKYGAYSVVEGKGDTYGYYTETYENGIPTYTYSKHASGWVAAVNAHSSATDIVLVNVISDWTAPKEEEMVIPSYGGNPYLVCTSTFGENDFGAEFLGDDFVHGFSENTILVPSNAYIRLNLNGLVIDRNLSATMINGATIVVEGNLELVDSAPEARHLDEDGNPVYTIKPTTDIALDSSGNQELVCDPELELTGGLITGANIPAYSNDLYFGGVCVYGGTFVMNGGTIAYNKSTLGAGVYVNTGTFVMNGGKIVSNEETSAPYVSIGGIGVYVTAGKFDMTGGEIAHNITVNGTGAGVWVSGDSEFRMSGGAIRNNVLYRTTDKGGGGVTVSSGKFIMSGNALIEKNLSTSVGGGVYLGNDGIMVMNDDSAVMHNSMPNSNKNFSYDIGGGGVCCYNGGTLVMNGNSSISYNHSEKYGGGVYVRRGGNIIINSGSISRNDSVNLGGGIYAESADINIYEKGEVVYNSTEDRGGGIFYRAGSSYSMNMRGGKISYNTAKAGGGGVCLYSEGTFNIYDGEVSHNVVTASSSAYSGGGGVMVYSNNCTLNMYGGKISYNKCSGTGLSGGGGVFVCSSGYIRMYDGEISNNVANLSDAADAATISVTGGGGVCVRGGYFYMSGGDIKNNATSKDGDGIFVAGSTYMSGSSKIYGNGEVEQDPDNLSEEVSFGKENSQYSNLYLYSSYSLRVNGKLNDDSEIHVTHAGSSEYFASNYEEYNNDKNSQTDYNYIIDPNKYFIADDPQYKVICYDHEQSYYGNVLKFVNITDELSVEVRYGEEPDSSSPIEVVGSGAYGITLPYKSGCTAKCVVKLNGEEVEVKTIAEVGKIDFEIEYAGKTLKYAVILTSELSADNVTVELKGYADYADGVYTYEYTSGAIEPEVKVMVGGSELEKDTDYTVTYGDNTEVGSASGSVIIEFTEESGYSGKITVDFDIDITGGSFTVTWQSYDYAENEWKDISGESVVFTYIPGENGNQSNAVRAKLSSSKLYNDAPLTKYAYAEGVTDYLDGDITFADISGYTVTIGGEQAATIWNVGNYTISLSGSDKLELGTVKSLAVEVVQFEISNDDDRLFAKIMGKSVFEYDATEKSVTVYVAFDDLVLKNGVDYNLEYENNIEGGTAVAKIVFCGNYVGEAELNFTITLGQNSWDKLPAIIIWAYGSFDAETNFIVASPKYLSNGDKIHASILNSDKSEIVVDGVSLTDIALIRKQNDTYGTYFAVADEDVIKVLNTLEVNMYELSVWVNATSSYNAIASQSQSFAVFKATNEWETAPSVTAWCSGDYDETINAIKGAARFGNVQYKIVDAETGDVVYYDSASGKNVLDSMPVGLYYLRATVAGNDNYSGLTESVLFRVLDGADVNIIDNSGIPWWGVLLIVFGVLIVLAAVVLILHIKGVFQILTGKMVNSIRERANVDATIAAVRMMRKNEEAKQAQSESAVAIEQEQQKEKAEVERKTRR